MDIILFNNRTRNEIFFVVFDLESCLALNCWNLNSFRHLIELELNT